MAQIETDYLVVGAGASGMAFTDTMLEQSDADVVIVDRRHRPGGHWVDAYPFVRLHQPAAWYGVASRQLEAKHMDLDADRAGLATGSEVCEYYQRVLEDHFLPSGRVRFLAMTDFCGGQGRSYDVRSLVSGEATTVRVRRKLVDARYPELSIPSRHTPSFEVDPGVRCIPPNQLVDLDRSASGYTVLGAGKTSMDACYWLLEHGVHAERIRWVRPRDVWMMDRARFVPADTGSPFLELQAMMVQAAVDATCGRDLAVALEASGAFHRLDPSVEPEVFRGATVSHAEAGVLRRIEDVVRLGRVAHIGRDSVTLSEGTIPTDPMQVHVDCTACGAAPSDRGPIFQPSVIDTNLTTFGVVPWSAALTAFVEATRDQDDEKNRLCPVYRLTGELDDLIDLLAVALRNATERMAEPDMAQWQDGLRLNPANGLSARIDQPEVQEVMATLMVSMQPALDNLDRLIAQRGGSPPRSEDAVKT